MHLQLQMAPSLPIFTTMAHRTGQKFETQFETSQFYQLLNCFIFHSYEETEIHDGDLVEYRCFNGMRSVLDLNFQNQSAKCTFNGSGSFLWETPLNIGEHWEVCTDTKMCPVPPEIEAGGSIYANSTGNRFGAVCLGETPFVNSTEQPEALPNCPLVSVLNVQHSSPGMAKYRFFISTEEVRADKVFFVLQFDAPVESVTATNFDNETLSANATYIPTISEQVIGLYAEFSLDPESTASVDVIISFPEEYSTLCLEMANCSRCSKDETGCDAFIENETASLANMSFYEPGKEWKYNTKLDYQCPPGKGFKHGAGNISVHKTLTCQWNQSWTLSEGTQDDNMTCTWTHCVDPPLPGSILSGSEVHPMPNLTAGALTEFNASVEYTCPRGMKFANDVGRQALHAVCRPNNEWDEPHWDKCIETKLCNPPPEPEPGVDFTIHSHGYLNGRECTTHGQYAVVNGSHDHKQGMEYRLRILQTSSVENGGIRTSSYKLEVTRNVKSDINMMLTFSQPINDSSMSITITSSLGVTMNLTSSDTSLIIGTKLNPLPDTTSLDMVITMPIEIPEPCIVHYSLMEGEICDPTTCMDSLKRNSVMQRQSPFGTKIEYACGLGKERQVSGLNETTPSVTIECDWNATWTPYTSIPECVWVGCIDPPLPPSGHFMKSFYEVGQVVRIGQGANYTCEDGYFFGEDKDMSNYSIPCGMNGTWETPDTWPKCFHPTKRYCYDPPHPPWGGTSDWDRDTYSGGLTPHGTKVTYSCGLGKRFVRYTENGKGPYYHNKTLTCQWNTTWAPEGLLDECEAVACAAPSVPDGSRLKLQQMDTLTFAFGKTATFMCDNSGIYFEQGREMKSFNLTCLENGRWNVPYEWPKCVESEYLLIHVTLMLGNHHHSLFKRCGVLRTTTCP